MIKFEKILGLFRKVFCECTDCGTVFRLSDTEIISNQKTDQDWLHKIDRHISLLEERIERAMGLFEKRKLLVIERERKLVERQTFRRINLLVPNFSKVRFNTRDIKTIGYPVKFISFDGKDDGCTKKIRLIDFIPETTLQERRFENIARTISKGNLEWTTLRITDDGGVVEEP